jgi:hypothetical protein
MALLYTRSSATALAPPYNSRSYHPLSQTRSSIRGPNDPYSKPIPPHRKPSLRLDERSCSQARPTTNNGTRVGAPAASVAQSHSGGKWIRPYRKPVFHRMDHASFAGRLPKAGSLTSPVATSSASAAAGSLTFHDGSLGSVDPPSQDFAHPCPKHASTVSSRPYSRPT